LLNHLVLLVSWNEEVIVLVIHYLSWDDDSWVLLVPTIQEELAVKLWLRWRVFTFLEFWRFVSAKGFLVLGVLLYQRFVLSFELLLCLLCGSSSILSTLLVLLNSLLALLFLDFGIVQARDDIFLTSFDNHGHPFVDETK
jgi:hypothetical protein